MIDFEDNFFFWKGPFSQWYPCSIQLDGRSFNCAEQAMMYLKADLFGDAEAAKQIYEAVDPGRQKALGRAVKGFDEAIWDRHKVSIVFRTNLAKFTQNKGLRRKLFQTGHMSLVEASPIDAVWGIGISESAARSMTRDLWPGLNLLGEILTLVREQLKVTFADEGAGKSWTIEGGVLPNGLQRELEKYLEDRQPIDVDGPPDPPWVVFPSFLPTSMGWRMGPGEDYVMEFVRWLRSQEARVQQAYMDAHPEPDMWAGFYARKLT